MRAAIIDDVALYREEIRECLIRCLDEKEAESPALVEEFTSGEEFLSAFTPETYDMIFIDQYMPGLSGVETAAKIRTLDQQAALVFVTSSTDHITDGCEVHACGYLVKPCRYEDFVKIVENAMVEKLRNSRFIRVDQENILLREILWCGQDGRDIQIHTDSQGSLRFRLPFRVLADLLAPYPQFLNYSKNCTVNLERVECMDGLDFVMDTGERIPFSRWDRKKIEERYRTWLFRKEREDLLV